MRGYIRAKVFEDYESVLKNLTIAKPLGNILIEGHHVDTNTDRYENLYYHKCKCAKCGAEAQYAALERCNDKNGKYHINVYTIQNGREIMLTKDHIYPRSLGGYDDLRNYQVLCERCNTKKGNKTDLTLEEAIEKGYTTLEIAAAARNYFEQKEVLRKINEELRRQQQLVNHLHTEYQKVLPKRNDNVEFVYLGKKARGLI